jgi:Amt family ammonium transporter
VDTGNTAWVLASSAMVLLMTPGLAFFYGGMVRAKSVLNMLMMNFVCIAVVTVAWVLYGWSVAFGNANDANGNGFWGTFAQWGMHGVGTGISGGGHLALYGSSGVPIFAVACFQLMFAIITPALISGAIADRTKFVGWAVYVAGWVTLIYFPVAHWVFSPNGFINARLHVMDFAGGTAVEINSGAGALACALVLGKRVGFRKDPMRPHNVPLVMLGAALLWFGWFGFNAGSALTSGGLGRVHEHADRRLYGGVRLAGRGEDPARHLHHHRRRLRRGGRPGRDHSVLRVGLPDRRALRRGDRGLRVLLRGEPQEPLRL